eukprot:11762-Heterococcus_DN1.PRE.3
MACCSKDGDVDDDVDRSDVPPDFKAQLEVIILSNGTAEQTEAAVHAMKALFDEALSTNASFRSSSALAPDSTVTAASRLYRCNLSTIVLMLYYHCYTDTTTTAADTSTVSQKDPQIAEILAELVSSRVMQARSRRLAAVLVGLSTYALQYPQLFARRASAKAAAFVRSHVISAEGAAGSSSSSSSAASPAAGTKKSRAKATASGDVCAAHAAAD